MSILTMAGQLGGAVLGMGLGDFNDRRQIRQQEKLQDLQMKGNKEMSDYQLKQQMKLWEMTNYKAQMEQLKKAGLNPGLMYGMGGGGGTTAAAAGGAGVSGGNAPSGGGEIMGMMNAALIQAQTENIKADTEKKKIEATKTAGVDTALAESNFAIQEIHRQIAEKTMDKTIEGITYQVGKTWKELSLLTQEDLVQTDEEVMNARRIGTIQAYLTATLTNKQIAAQTKLTDEQAKAIATTIAQKWAEIGQGNAKLAIDAFKAEMEANRPGLMNVLGGQVQELVEGIYDLMGAGKKRTTKQSINR